MVGKGTSPCGQLLALLLLAGALGACDVTVHSWVPDDASADVAASDAASGDAGPDVAAEVDPLADVVPFDPATAPAPYCDVDEAAVDALHAALTPRQRIGQHLMVGIGFDSEGLMSTPETMIVDYGMGGAFLGPPAGMSADDAGVTAERIAIAQEIAIATTGVPLFLSLDQEGGANSAFNRVTGGTDTIGSLPIGATRSPQIAFEQFEIMGREVRAIGFNMALAPSLDTLTSTRNGNLNTRAFGPDPQLNAMLGVAAVAGFQSNLVLAVGKHFPGDGLSDGNPHVDQVSVDASRAELDAGLLVPFAAAIDSGLDGIMTIPVNYGAFDPARSAITSRAITTDLLRGDLGFEGLVVTDSLGMAGASLGLGEDETTEMEALRAGADILLHVTLQESALEPLYLDIEAALTDGRLDPDEFEASTRRILRMKQRYCLFEAPLPDPDAARAAVAQSADAAVSRGHADQALVLVDDPGSVIPLTGKAVAYIGPDTLFQDPGSTWLNVVDQTFADALAAHDATVVSTVWVLIPNPDALYEDTMALIAEQGSEVLVIGTLQGRFSLEQQQLIEWLLDAVDIPVVHVALGVPFDLLQTRGRVDASLAVMNSRSVMVEAGAAVLYGEQGAPGTLLYDLDAEGAPDGVAGGGPGSSGERDDRCVSEAIVCSGDGVCVDTGAKVGCVCRPNWHASGDGRDCLPDGS